MWLFSEGEKSQYWFDTYSIPRTALTMRPASFGVQVGCFDRLSNRGDEVLLTLQLTGTVIDHASAHNPVLRSLHNAENLNEEQSS